METEYSINYNAESFEDAKKYLSYKYKQIRKFGYLVDEEIEVDNKSIVTLYKDPNGDNYWGSIYVLKQFRRNQIFIKNLQQFMIAIVTLEECKIKDYLDIIKVRYKLLKHSDAYKKIQEFYGDQRTVRSGVPLIYHIDEGGAILDSLGASDIVKDAYYLHPLFQSDKAFNEKKNISLDGISSESIILSIEYRRIANSYLSTMNPKDQIEIPCEEIKQMLIADKVQNYKDFKKYHSKTHGRRQHLEEYFQNWFNILEIDYSNWEHFDYGGV